METREIQQILDFAPAEKKLEALAQLNTAGTQLRLADFQERLDKIVFGRTDKTPLRFYATRASIVLGDKRDSVIDALTDFFGEQIFERRKDDVIRFPWMPQDLPEPELELSWLPNRLSHNISYAVLESLGRATGSEKAASFLNKILNVVEGSDGRAICIYAMGALGHQTNRTALEYYRTSMATTPEGRAAELALQRFGTVSVFDLMREHSQAHRAKSLAPKKTGCYVITAVCGNPTSREVWVCRAFRDEVLQKSYLGRELVKAYYVLSPVPARYIAARPLLRQFLRVSTVAPIVAFLSFAGVPKRALRHRLTRSS